jgi:hypothetical protein
MESSGSLVGVFCQNIGKWESSETCVDSDSVDCWQGCLFHKHIANECCLVLPWLQLLVNL